MEIGHVHKGSQSRDKRTGLCQQWPLEPCYNSVQHTWWSSICILRYLLLSLYVYECDSCLTWFCIHWPHCMSMEDILHEVYYNLRCNEGIFVSGDFPLGRFIGPTFPRGLWMHGSIMLYHTGKHHSVRVFLYSLRDSWRIFFYDDVNNHLH